MFNIIKKEMNWCGKNLVLETGKVARQADGAVVISYGETTVLCTVVANKQPTAGVDFLPLTVHYREMNFAAGKIPGGFFRREGKASEKETVTSRLVDRVIRPLFPKNFYNEIQVICTVLSYDGENDSDTISIIGTAAALAVAGIPFNGPIAATKIGMIGGELIVNPTIQQSNTSSLDLAIGGSNSSIVMVEAGAHELGEDKMIEALNMGFEALQPVINLILELKKEAGKPEWEVPAAQDNSSLEKQIRELAFDKLAVAYTEQSKQERVLKIKSIKAEVLTQVDLDQYSESLVATKFKALEEEIVRGNILDKNTRIDGRDSASIRPITAEVSAFYRTHGSAIFTRGETQAIVVTTLGSGQDEQMIDSLDGNLKERFMLHYNFLPYSVGETSPVRAPGRREIGHGKLAWRAIYPVLPSKEDFPYTLRTVAEITACNGSSSMATICGTSLSLMDAGVPIKKPVAGIAMGLIMKGKNYAVLSDILGDEDNLGDMDFKVAGTDEGITALQMDIKVSGVTIEIMTVALEQARKGRLHILERMSHAISEHRESINKHAPSITSIAVPKDKIGLIIGPGGKTIKDMCEKTGAKIDIDDNGLVSIASSDAESGAKAMEMIKSLISEVKIGETYEGTVVKLLDFGAVISFLGSKEGLLHISEISSSRIDNIHDVMKEGDKINVRVIGIDEKKRKLKLSTKPINEAPSSPAEPKASPTEPKVEDVNEDEDPEEYNFNKEQPQENDHRKNDRNPGKKPDGFKKPFNNNKRKPAKPPFDKPRRPDDREGNSTPTAKKMKYFNF